MRHVATVEGPAITAEMCVGLDAECLSTHMAGNGYENEQGCSPPSGESIQVSGLKKCVRIRRYTSFCIRSLAYRPHAENRMGQAKHKAKQGHNQHVGGKHTPPASRLRTRNDGDQSGKFYRFFVNSTAQKNRATFSELRKNYLWMKTPKFSILEAIKASSP